MYQYVREKQGNSIEKTIKCDIMDNKEELNDKKLLQENHYKIPFHKIS